MRLNLIALFAGALVLSACSQTSPEQPTAAPATTDASAAAAPTDTAASASTSGVAPAAGMEGMTAEEHAAMGAGTNATAGAHPEGHNATSGGQADSMAGMDHGAMSGAGQGGAAGGAQAGWYRGGTFQPCGSTQPLKVSQTRDIDAKIRAGDMSATDPVYVRLEGSAANGTFNVTRVAQVGSPTPVRDCPMTGTTTQG
jgi:hypothetical protein